MFSHPQEMWSISTSPFEANAFFTVYSNGTISSGTTGFQHFLVLKCSFRDLFLRSMRAEAIFAIGLVPMSFVSVTTYYSLY